MPDPNDPSSYDLTGKQQKLIDRRALFTDLGIDNKLAKNQRRLERTGLTEDDINALVSTGDADQALLNMSVRGGIHGRKAAAYSTRLGLQDLEEAAGLAESSAREDIAYSTGALSDRLRAALGPGIDPSSPSVLFLQQQHQLMRETSLESALRNIQTDLAERKAAVRSGQLASIYTDIGDTVDALRAIREEEKALSGSMTGYLVGGLTGSPFLGAAFGGAFGGSRGAVSGLGGGFAAQSAGATGSGAGTLAKALI